MSHKKYEDDCEGCQPAMLDPKTMTPLPKDHPAMLVMMAVWETLTLAQKEAFHNVTINNSRLPAELEVFNIIQQRMRATEQPGN